MARGKSPDLPLASASNSPGGRAALNPRARGSAMSSMQFGVFGTGAPDHFALPAGFDPAGIPDTTAGRAAPA